MRKRLITPTQGTVRSHGKGWLDVERAAMVEITSEEKDYPVESAFASDEAQGWRAAEPGSQTIRLIFDQPQRLKLISLVFEENEISRTQEFVLRWSSDSAPSFPGKSSVSSGTSALLRPQPRSRNIKWNFPTSPYLNWSSCRI